jgi:hypothetical protein
MRGPLGRFLVSGGERFSRGALRDGPWPSSGGQGERLLGRPGRAGRRDGDHICIPILKAGVDNVHVDNAAHLTELSLAHFRPLFSTHLGCAPPIS